MRFSLSVRQSIANSFNPADDTDSPSFDLIVLAADIEDLAAKLVPLFGIFDDIDEIAGDTIFLFADPSNEIRTEIRFAA